MAYTPPVYPGTIPTQTGDTPDLPDRIDDLDWLYAARYNELKKELCAALVELGTNPKGIYADVKAAIAAALAGSIPSGLIAMWHGLIANIPAGWVICDGNNGTPNLLDKFIKGVPTAVTNPGDTGGASTVALVVSEIPSHQHSISSDGSHSHNRKQGADDEAGANLWGVNGTVNAASDAAGAHAHGGNTGLIGDGGSHENKPPYYEVAFIMKT